MSLRLLTYVGYSHLDLRALHELGAQIHRIKFVEVEEVDPETHAKDAPPESEWFGYYTGDVGVVCLPIETELVYLLDTQPEPMVRRSDVWVAELRVTGMTFPFDPKRNAVISSR